MLIIIKLTNWLLRDLTAKTHAAQRFLEWGLKPNPEWFDHFIGLYCDWSLTGNPLSWERGIFNLLGIKENANILELCCGDGFNAHHFYRIRAREITSLDYDQRAIEHARKFFKSNTSNYKVCDIRKGLPAGKYDNVIWDAAIEHFTFREIEKIMSEIKKRLVDGGIVSGYTIVERDHGAQHDEHEYEFKSKEDLENLLKDFFPHYQVIETIYPTRHNLYFFASEKRLDFLEQFHR